MRGFEVLYARVMRLAESPRAPAWLAGLSLLEAFAFPVMPELMLAPMGLAQPSRAFRFANLSLFFSILGSLIGYGLGHAVFDRLRPLLARVGWLPLIEHWADTLRVQALHHPWSVFGMLMLAGFVPVPMKVFAWASGVVGIPLLPFVASMALGRGKRVWLLAWLLRRYGARAEPMLRRYSQAIGGWLVVVVLLLAGLWWLRHQTTMV